MSPDNRRVQAVEVWPVPADVTALHSFLGLASYYRRHYFLTLQMSQLPFTISHKRVFHLFAEANKSRPSSF